MDSEKEEVMMSTLQFIVSWVFVICWFFLAFIFIFGVQPWWVSAAFFIAGYLALSKINRRVKSELEWLITKTGIKKSINAIPAALVLSGLLGVGAFIVSVEISYVAQEAGNKINNATAQIEHAEPAKELDLPEISNTEPEANTFSDAEIAAAMAVILRDARAEKTVLAASWQTYPTGARILVAEASDNGTKRDGFADYLCIGIRSKNIPRASVTIVRDLSRGPLDIDNILGIQSCF